MYNLGVRNTHASNSYLLQQLPSNYIYKNKYKFEIEIFYISNIDVIFINNYHVLSNLLIFYTVINITLMLH